MDNDVKTWINFTDLNEDVEELDIKYVMDENNYKKMSNQISDVFSGTLQDLNIFESFNN